MCGINGILNFNQSPIQKSNLEAMNQLMLHRGPDEDGFYLNQSLGLSMRRLSVIDLATGHQPVSNEDGTVQIVFNGEIYNYIELRHELIARGHKFKTNSDTEAIVHLYEEKGVKAIEHLNGVFCFALWDDAKKQLFVARDRIGVKPLFYYKTANQFAFSSELKSLMKIAPFPKKINKQSFLMYLLFMYVPDPLSMIEGVNKLEAGHYLIFDQSGHAEKVRYWDLEKKSDFQHLNLNQSKERLLFLLNDAVRLQLRSDVPLGIFLSGGLDSSALVALASGMTNKPIATLSVGYEGHSVDERSFARQIAEQYHTRHHELLIRPRDVQKHFHEMIWLMDEPFSDSASVSTYLLAKLARDNGLHVVLSGAGGDEVFGGYGRYSFDWKHPAKMMHRSFSEFGRMRNSDWQFDYICSIGCGRGLGRFLSQNNFDKTRFHETFQAIMDPSAKQTGDWPTALQKKSYLDLKNYLIGDILMLTDKMTMGASVEARVPLLDHRLVEFMFNLPDNFKINNAEKKYLLKQAMCDKLPMSILNRPKMGFGAPVQHWLNELFSGESEDFNVILNGRTLDYSRLRGHHSFRQILFGLEIFKSWQKNVFNKFL
ncbi:MAG: asparagine synthase (glutamine-hydrolyzing) [Parcubacteria group bacterium]